ncbi:MAG: hypothetical protein WD646_12915 [Actinomycetota bacterium]
MRAFHSYWAYIVLATNLAVGVAGLVLWRRRATPTRTFWIAVALAWSTIYVQGALGLALFEKDKPPFKHHFYGFLFAIITLCVLPVRSERPRTRLLVFSVASLFIGIVAVRAITSL